VELARKAAERSFVLLKNDAVNARPILPLGKDVQTVALIGPLADDAGNMLGSWAGRGKAQDAVTLKSALVERLGADHVKYAKGGNIQNASAEQIDEAVAAASAANVVIMALGEDAGTMTAEAASRAYLDLPGQQEQLLERVAATGKPVVLILFSGRPLILPWAFQHVPAVLAAWFPGIQAGPALTRVLFGDVAPEGKLVMSWPRAVGQIPVYYNAQSTGRPAGDTDLTHPATDGVEKYVSRYIDVQNSPQFPFGYGLSYTDFAYSKPEISASKLGAKDLNSNLRKTEGKNAVLTVTAEVKNTGQFTTEEVVQLYVRLEGTSMAEPVRALKGFQRVALGPGESRKVTFSLGAEAFALWSIDNDWRVEPSRVHVWVSPDSARGEAAELQIAE
jgi:beta-glucosidase